MMYPFPHEPRVRLWDFPGGGTEACPNHNYIARSGLRYFDKVIIVSAGRFTQMEVQLRTELQALGIPYYMVRTKVDVDVWNNRIDNGSSETDSVREIQQDLIHKGISRPYLVSLRDVTLYDHHQLQTDLFPFIKDSEEAWTLPQARPRVVSGLQGQWTDSFGTVYYVQGLEVHITSVTFHGNSILSMVQDEFGSVWWQDTYRVDECDVDQAHKDGKLLWHHINPQHRSMVWTWSA